jgi:hypothetical protein
VYRIQKTDLRLNVAPETDAVKFCFSPGGALTEEWGHYRGYWVPQPIFPTPVVPPRPSQL